MDALLPCPFCGSSDVHMHANRGYSTGSHIGKYMYSAGCGDCGAQMPWVKTEKEAADAWNIRAGDA